MRHMTCSKDKQSSTLPSPQKSSCFHNFRYLSLREGRGHCQVSWGPKRSLCRAINDHFLLGKGTFPNCSGPPRLPYRLPRALRSTVKRKRRKSVFGTHRRRNSLCETQNQALRSTVKRTSRKSLFGTHRGIGQTRKRAGMQAEALNNPEIQRVVP